MQFSELLSRQKWIPHLQPWLHGDAVLRVNHREFVNCFVRFAMFVSLDDHFVFA